jgi:hypothetical protein
MHKSVMSKQRQMAFERVVIAYGAVVDELSRRQRGTGDTSFPYDVPILMDDAVKRLRIFNNARSTASMEQEEWGKRSLGRLSRRAGQIDGRQQTIFAHARALYRVAHDVVQMQETENLVDCANLRLDLVIPDRAITPSMPQTVGFFDAFWGAVARTTAKLQKNMFTPLARDFSAGTLDAEVIARHAQTLGALLLRENVDASRYLAAYYTNPAHRDDFFRDEIEAIVDAHRNAWKLHGRDDPEALMSVGPGGQGLS